MRLAKYSVYVSSPNCHKVKVTPSINLGTEYILICNVVPTKFYKLFKCTEDLEKVWTRLVVLRQS